MFQIIPFAAAIATACVIAGAAAAPAAKPRARLAAKHATQRSGSPPSPWAIITLRRDGARSTEKPRRSQAHRGAPSVLRAYHLGPCADH